MKNVSNNIQPPRDAGAGQVVVLVNPTAGRGQAGKQIGRLRRLLGASAEDWIWRFTQTSGDAERWAREAAAQGAAMVVAVGGDGTLHEVANGILGSNSVLGLIPFGTGNDLARAVNLYGSLERACKAVTEGDTIPIDVGIIEGSGTDGPRHFLVIAGTGFDARTAQTVNAGVRGLSGAAAYVYGAVATLAKFSPFDLTITIDGTESRQCRAMFVSIANAATTGGGMRIAPDAIVNDGILDICLVAETSKAQLLYQLTKVFKGEHVRHPAVTMLKAKTVELGADPPQPLLIDGEVIGMTPARISLLPQAIRMKVPRAQAPV